VRGEVGVDGRVPLAFRGSEPARRRATERGEEPLGPVELLVALGGAEPGEHRVVITVVDQLVPLADHPAHGGRVQLGEASGHAEGGGDALPAEQVEDLGGVAEVAAAVESQGHRGGALVAQRDQCRARRWVVRRAPRNGAGHRQHGGAGRHVQPPQAACVPLPPG